jgi:hypothetical protein
VIPGSGWVPEPVWKLWGREEPFLCCECNAEKIDIKKFLEELIVYLPLIRTTQKTKNWGGGQRH